MTRPVAGAYENDSTSAREQSIQVAQSRESPKVSCLVLFLFSLLYFNILHIQRAREGMLQSTLQGRQTCRVGLAGFWRVLIASGPETARNATHRLSILETEDTTVCYEPQHYPIGQGLDHPGRLGLITDAHDVSAVTSGGGRTRASGTRRTLP
jgi:hypothetical protein